MRADLCRPCVEHLKREGHKAVKVVGGVDKKVTCERCGLRRYGATYELTPRWKDAELRAVKGQALIERDAEENAPGLSRGEAFGFAAFVVLCGIGANGVGLLLKAMGCG